MDDSLQSFMIVFISQHQINFLLAFPCRSNKSLQKYFSGLETALMGMNINELYSPKFDRTKHGSLFLSQVKGYYKAG